MTDLNSRPYNPDPAKCCEACIFGRGEHADFCARGQFTLAEDRAIQEILASVGL